MTSKMSLSKLPVKGLKVLVRVDFNVPLDKNGNITDDSRIVQTLPTLHYILDHGGSIILMSHIGRPEGKKQSKYSMAPCAERLQKLLGKEVILAPDCIGEQVKVLAKNLMPGQILLLENLRFYEAEEEPERDSSFAKQLAELGDCYVDDAFGTAHRAHSSTVKVPELFPGKAVAGFLMESEIKFFYNLLKNPQRPFYAILGGAKVSGKLEVLRSLIKQVNGIFIAGGMTYTFAKAQGIEIGDSICEEELVPVAKDILKECKESQVNVWMAEDVIIADSFTNDAKKQVIPLFHGIPDGWRGMDIGPKTLKNFEHQLQEAKTLFWNGPVGVFEFPNFANGTLELAKIVAGVKALTIVGGGDTLAAINAAGVAAEIDHLSTGGGASLEFLQYGTLPGIEALRY